MSSTQYSVSTAPQNGELYSSKDPSFGLRSDVAALTYRDTNDEQTSTPNTPTMTNVSSYKSATSSVIICDNDCGNFDPCCACQSQFESERVPDQHFDNDCWQKSPKSSHLVAGRMIKGKIRLCKSPLRVPIFPNEDTSYDARTPISQSPSMETSDNLFPKLASPEAVESSQEPAVCPSAPKYSEIAKASHHYESDISDENDEDDEDLDDEDNEWSGQNDDLEAIVIEALQGDLELAAQLIPVLHNALYSQITSSVTQKVGPWRQGVNYSPGYRTATADKGSSTNTRTSDTTSNSRKRQRQSGSASHTRKMNDDEKDEEGEDEEESPEPLGPGNPPEGVSSPLRLACPFNKHNPAKYGVQHDASDAESYYRSCTGPGFKSIQRLKEHLRRKHSPVQCDRCYHIFPGPDRAVCVQDLQTHRQLPTPCQRGSASLQEGISEAQWASLEKKKTGKNQQVTNRISKWFEIWVFIFPGAPKPDNPWYADQDTTRTYKPLSPDSIRFANQFAVMLDHKVNGKDILFPEGLEEVMKTRVKDLVQQAFALHLGLVLNQSSTASSSSRSRLLEGSYAHVRRPSTAGLLSSSTESRSTAGRSQAYSMDILSSSPSNPSELRRQNLITDTSYMTMGPMVGNFNPNGLQSQDMTHPSYQMNLPSYINTSVPVPFQQPGFAATGGNWNIDFNGVDTPYDNVASVGFVNESGHALNPTLLSSSEDDAQADLQVGWARQHPTFDPRQQR